MQTVTTVNLNGNAYQIEDAGYGALLRYLDSAEAQLKDNPDRAEILADLEQAIAEKFRKFLNAQKSVVSSGEMDQIIKEMGPVDGGAGASDAGAHAGADAQNKAPSQGGSRKRLYQIREGSIVSGVCNGLAAYFSVDVTIVRIVFVVLAVLTKGVWLIAYVVLMFVIPYADTPEERAAAQGVPFSAQVLIDQAKRNYAEFRDDTRWKRHWRRQTRRWRHEWRRTMREQRWSGRTSPPTVGYAGQVLFGVMVPLLGLMNAALFMFMAYGIVSLSTTGGLLGRPLPAGIPLWAGILTLVVIYQVVTSPLNWVRHVAYVATPRHPYGWVAVWGGVLWIGFAVLLGWLGYQHVQAVRDFIDSLPRLLDEMRRQTR